MRKLLLIPILLLCGGMVQAQSNSDTLWSTWSNEALEDTVRLSALDELIGSDELIEYPDSAFQLIEEMLAYSIAQGNQYYQFRSYYSLAEIQITTENYLEAENSLFKAIEIAKKVDIKEELSNAYWNLGIIYFWMGQYSKSLDNYSICIDLREELDLSTTGLLNNIGLIYNQQKDFNNALDYFDRSIKKAEEAGWVNSTAMGNSGDAHIELGNFEEALACYKMAIQVVEEEEEGYTFNCSMKSLTVGMGDAYLKMEDYDQAMDYYKSSYEYDQLSYDCSSKTIPEINIGVLFEIMGQSDQAIEWCTKGYNRAIENLSTEQQHMACNCLFMSYKRKGDNLKALEYLELTNMLSDSLNSEETSRSLQHMEYTKQLLADSLKQEEEKLKLTITYQNEVYEKEKMRNIFLVFGLLLSLLAIGLYRRNRFVRKAKNHIEKEKDRSDNLLLNILPADIAAELKEKGRADARDFDLVSILFTDFKDFTATGEKLSAQELVEEINVCFEAFDSIMDKYGVEKIKTIGDAYMAAGGLPVPTDDSTKNTVLAGLEIQTFINKRKREMDAAGKPAFEMRVGIHTGPVVAGIVGVKKFQYDIWGDTVNTASRMESSGQVGHVNISQTTYNLLKNDPSFTFESRGKIEAKGKGELDMYFVSKA